MPAKHVAFALFAVSAFLGPALAADAPPVVGVEGTVGGAVAAVVGKLLEYGPIGIVCIVALYVAWKKDRECAALKDRLIEKTEKDAEKYYQFATEMNNTMKALTETVVDGARQQNYPRR